MPRTTRKPDLNRDPRDPELLAWLETLDPYEELTVRLALRGKHQELSSDQVFGDRVKALLAFLDPSPQETAAIVRRARELEKDSNEVPAENDPPAKNEASAGNEAPAKPAPKPRRP
jgi:hypothetical protein